MKMKFVLIALVVVLASSFVIHAHDKAETQVAVEDEIALTAVDTTVEELAK